MSNFLGIVQYPTGVGLLKTLQYGALVGYDSFSTLLTDTYFDLKYSGKPLFGNKKTTYKHLGANDVYHTDYAVMPLIFKHIEIKKDDVLVDVGCGKGRVINYWLSQHYQNPIYGLELDEKVANSTARQFAKRPNVQIIAGDAIKNLPAEGTVFYFYNPFGPEKFRELESMLAKSGKQLKMIYYNPKSLHVFDNPRWQIQKINFEQDLCIKRWGRINKYHDLAIIQPSG
jgi:hypothetical protein